MKRILLFIIIVMSLSECISQNKGYIEFETVTNSILEYQNCKLNILGLKEKYNDSIKSIVQKFFKNNFRTNNNISRTPEEHITIQDTIEKVEQTITFLKESAFVDLMRKANECDSIVKSYIEIKGVQFSAEHKIEYLTYKSELILCEKCENYTAEFIQFIKQGE